MVLLREEVRPPSRYEPVVECTCVPDSFPPQAGACCWSTRRLKPLIVLYARGISQRTINASTASARSYLVYAKTHKVVGRNQSDDLVFCHRPEIPIDFSTTVIRTNDEKSSTDLQVSSVLGCCLTEGKRQKPLSGARNS